MRVGLFLIFVASSAASSPVSTGSFLQKHSPPSRDFSSKGVLIGEFFTFPFGPVADPPPLQAAKPTDSPFLLSDNVVRGGGSNEYGPATAEIAPSVFNLVNNVAGAGLLTLSAAMAKGTGWVPALCICFVLGSISAHSFNLIGESCRLTGEMDFKGLWTKVRRRTGEGRRSEATAKALHRLPTYASLQEIPQARRFAPRTYHLPT